MRVKEAGLYRGNGTEDEGTLHSKDGPLNRRHVSLWH